MQRKNKVYWHDAFFEALQLELHNHLDALKFVNEHQLSKEALIVDVLVVKKEHGINIEKNIGKIFRETNLFEFKSESDSLTVRGYNKVMGYAYLYASFTPIDVSDITISFVTTMHPRNLLDYLEKSRKFNVTRPDEGIYHIDGETFPVQILESKKLSENKDLFLRNLRSNLSIAEAKRTVDAYKNLKEFESKNVYIDRLARANQAVFKEAMNVSDTAIREIVITALAKESGLLAEHYAEKAKEMAREMLSDGESAEKVAKWTKLPLDTVRALV